MVQYETKIKAEKGKQEIFVSRIFNAPRGLVFRAHTEPELQVKWRGPKKFTMDIDKFEPKTEVLTESFTMMKKEMNSHFTVFITK